MKKIPMLAVAALSLLASSVMAAVKSEAVHYEYDGTKLTGYLYYDDAITEKRPGVMVVHEWWGLNDYAKHRAEAQYVFQGLIPTAAKARRAELLALAS